MRNDAESSFARAWIAAQDDLEDATRLDAVRVAADRLQAEGHPLGELATLGLALLDQPDPHIRERLREAYQARIPNLIAAGLGPFASLMTHPKAYAPRWSVCYLDRVGLPLAKAHRYAGLLGVPQLDPRGMLELFLDQPAAHCLRSLALDLDDVEGWLPEILQTIAEFRAPIETITIVSRGPGVEGVLRTWTEAAALPYLHTLIVNRVVLHLPGGDPDVEWTGDAASIRALGRAATGADLTASERALDRIRRMNRNSDRYFEAVCAGEPVDTRTIRSFGRDAMLDYTAEASSFVRQREQYEIDGINPRWSLRALWRELMPKHAWVNSLEAFAARVTAHNRTHDSAELRALPIAAMRDDPAWIAFRAEAGRLREHFLDSQG